MNTTKPTGADFDKARAAVPAQHPVADALLAALDDAQHGNEIGTISDEYAHEVIRWVQRSAMRMAEQLQSQHQLAMQALDAHQRSKQAFEHQRRIERTLVKYLIMPLLALALALFIIGGAAAFIWLR